MILDLPSSPKYNKSNIVKALREYLDYEYVMLDILDNPFSYKKLLYEDNLWFWYVFFNSPPPILHTDELTAKRLDKVNMLKELSCIYDFSSQFDVGGNNILSLANNDLTGVYSNVLVDYIKSNNLHYSLWLGGIGQKRVLSSMMRKLTLDELDLINEIDDIFSIEEACEYVVGLAWSLRLPDVYKQEINSYIKEKFNSLGEFKNNISRVLYVMDYSFFTEKVYDRKFKFNSADYLIEHVQSKIESELLLLDKKGFVFSDNAGNFKV